MARCPEPERLASVASFFVSRVDSKVDKALATIGTDPARELAGTIAIANSKATYSRYQELFCGTPFQRLREQGVQPQRVLWASTSTKNPSYRDVLYVEELIGPETVNTVPPQTLNAFRDHGRVHSTLMTGLEKARAQLTELAELGIDLDTITQDLQTEGVEKFSGPYDALLASLEAKRAELVMDRASEAVAE